MQTSEQSMALPMGQPVAAAAKADQAKVSSTDHPQGQVRDLWPAVLRGWRCRCPACGAGPVFRGYLKVQEQCPSCGEELFHQRADDGPAYLTLIVVGHIMAPVMLLLFGRWDPDPLISATILSVLFAALCLFLLPRMKGAFIGLQWSRRMHGFRLAPTA